MSVEDTIAKYRLEQLAPVMLGLAADLDALRPHLGQISAGQLNGLRAASLDISRKLEKFAAEIQLKIRAQDAFAQIKEELLDGHPNPECYLEWLEHQPDDVVIQKAFWGTRARDDTWGEAGLHDPEYPINPT